MSHADSEADRSLLFASLAAHSGRITHEQMDEALRLWAADRSRFVGEVLVELGTIDPETKAAVEVLMLEHLARHGDDPVLVMEALAAESEAPPPDWRSPSPAACPSVVADPVSPSTVADATAAIPDLPGDAYGPPPSGGPRFRVLRPHARGGLGEVHVARDEELEREVALKEIQRRFADDPGSRARFLVEAKITGNLEHPGIVPVYGLGWHDDGRPYYAMRLVRGESLRDAIARFHRAESRARSPGDRAVRLRKLIVRFLAVCEAIEYAHSRGVIHRDLKPSNILLGPYGETLIIDWGLAKPIGAVGPEEAAAGVVADADPEPSTTAIDLDATVAVSPDQTPVMAGGSGSTERTRPGSAVGTPQYMAPEQARGELERLGPASDVYSLGATLYAIITGHAPVDDDEDVAAVIGRVGAGELVPARSRDRSIAPDLEAICSRAMALDPDGRYPSARALAEDLERWLADEPVSARVEPVTARLGRWARRHKARVAGAVAATLVGLASLGIVAAARLGEERARLGQKAAEAEARSAEVEVQAARRAARLERYYALLDRLRRRAADPQPGWTWKNDEGLAQAAEIRGDAEHDGAETLRTLAAEAQAAFDFRPAPDLSPGLNPSCLAFSPDGSRLALGEFKAQAYLNCSVVLVEWPGGTVARRLSFLPSMAFQIRRGVQDGARRIAFDAGGRWLAVGTRSGRVHYWDLSRDDPIPTSWEAHADEVLGLAFVEGGDAPVLLSCGGDGPLHRWRLDESGRAPDAPVSTFRAGGPVRDLAFSPSGGLACLADGRLYRLDPETLASRGEVPEVRGDRLAWSPDGRILAAGAGDAITLVIAEGEGGRAFRRLIDPEIAAAHRQSLSGLAFHPDGAILASSCSVDADRRVKFWDASTGRLLGSSHDAEGAGFGIIDVAFHPGGDRLVATGHDRAAVFELSPHPAYASVALDDTPVRALDLSADGRVLARLGRSAEAAHVGLWGVPGGERVAGLDVPAEGSDPSGEHSLAISPAGDRLAVGVAGPSTFLATIAAAGTSTPIPLAIPESGSLQFSDDGRRLWARYEEGEAIGCWDLSEGSRRIVRWSDAMGRILWGLDRMVSLAVDEPWLLAGGRDGRARMLRRRGDGPSLHRQWDLDDGPVSALAVLPGAVLVACGTEGGSIALIRPSDPDPEALSLIPDAHPGGVSRLAFGPDGVTLTSGGLDRAVRLWRVDGPRLLPIATLGHANGPIVGLDFSPDAMTLAVAADGEHAVRLWRLDRLDRRWSGLGLGGIESRRFLIPDRLDHLPATRTPNGQSSRHSMR